MATAFRSHGDSGAPRSSGSCSDASSAVEAEVPLVSDSRQSFSPGSFVSGLCLGSSLMASGVVGLLGSSPGASSLSPSTHRCINIWLGCPSSRSDSLRDEVSGGEISSGKEGRPAGLKRLPRPPSGQVGNSYERQHQGGGVSLEERGKRLLGHV